MILFFVVEFHFFLVYSIVDYWNLFLTWKNRLFYFCRQCLLVIGKQLFCHFWLNLVFEIKFWSFLLKKIQDWKVHFYVATFEDNKLSECLRWIGHKISSSPRCPGLVVRYGRRPMNERLWGWVPVQVKRKII